MNKKLITKLEIMTIIEIAILIVSTIILTSCATTPYKDVETTEIEEEIVHNMRTSEDKTVLAVRISNRDESVEELDQAAKELGYNDYYEACKNLAGDGYLVYVPKFTYEGNEYGNQYTCPDTILASIAREQGIIE